MCHSAYRFFGLTDEYIRLVYDSYFLMKFHGGFSLFESYNLPIKIRNYFLMKLTQQIEREAQEIQKIQSKSKK